ncbi:MAG: hypothetical protein MI924_26435 [Chloroflexales bacterium]|nr:hypothetical protein [Chloroflexales bacterium]
MKEWLAFIGLFSTFGVANGTEYAEGQVWSYKNRPDEEHSTVLINKIESHEQLGNIYHIGVYGVKVRNLHIKGGISTKLPHLPVSEDCLRKSLAKLADNDAPSSDYVEGYKTWKQAFDVGKAGIFTITIAEIVDVIEQTVNKKYFF